MKLAFEAVQNLYRDLFGNPEAKKPNGRARRMQNVHVNTF
jgi:hypothetical protein